MKNLSLAGCGLLLLACGSGAIEESNQSAVSSGSAIRHLVVIVQENHSFDNYFGNWCTAPAGSNPACTKGAACCEAAPAKDPGTGKPQLALTDSTNAGYDPDHTRACELAKMNGGLMNKYVSASCGDARNFAFAGAEVAQYKSWAEQYAIADRYFQPVAGASSSNDMYFATARYYFSDNAYEPKAIGHGCSINRSTIQYKDPIIGDLLAARNLQTIWYAEGYQAMVDSWICPASPDDCPSWEYFPCIYEPADVPVAYFAGSADNPARMRDYARFKQDLASGALPDVAFVKPITYHNEHPGYGTTVSDGVTFVTQMVQAIEQSAYANSTLVLLTWDESGGYFDHVAPPPASAADGQPYGPRVPLLALGPFARRGTVSHVPMEHSSIVKFIEWNWLGATGQLRARDAVVNNIGSLLDPAKTGVVVPAH
jgi:phospholipase C